MISVIIPTLNEEAMIAASLDHLGGQAGLGEIIVADGGSRDATVSLARGHGQVRVVRCKPGRAVQMNAGAAAAKGEVLLFLHADTRLPPGGAELIRRALADPAVTAGCFCLSFDHPHPALRFYALCSRVNLVLFSYGDQGLFLRAELFRRLGGFEPLPIMEDLAMQRRLRRMGRFVKLQRPVVTSARRYLTHGVLRQQALNTALVLLYLLGASPRFLRGRYPY